MKRLTVYAVLILAVVAGMIWYLVQDTSLPGPPNNQTAIDFRAVPPDYESVGRHLLRRPLQSRPSEDKLSPTTFRQLSDSGIQFKNYFDRNRALELLDTGSGVAIGDYDNNGLPDVYLVGSDIGNQLYRNLGNMKFENVTFDAGVEGSYNNKNLWGSGATFADVDNDGDLDLFVCNMVGPNLLYINQGDGTFDEQSYLRGCNYIGASKSANFCDYDQDGDLDLYVVTYQDKQPDRSVDPVEIVDGKKRIKADMRDQFAIVGEGVVKAGEADILYRNDGEGNFEDVTESAGLMDFGTTLAAVWFDYNQDGLPDLYASNDFHAPDRLYENQGDGSFVDKLPELVRHTPWFSMGNDAGDLNNDGLDDLITADMSGTSHYRRKVDMGDMGDSAFFLTYGRPRQYMKNALFINSGNGPFFEIAGMAGMTSTDWTWSTRLVDLNNDGKLDVYVTNGHARDIMNADISAKMESFRDPSQKADLEEFYTQIPPRKETNFAFENLGDLKFRSTAAEWGLDHLGISHGAAFSDLDGDGDLDLVVNNYFENALVYQNDSTTGARTLFEFRANENNFFGVGVRVEVWQGELYQAKTLHSSRGYLSSDAPQVHFGGRAGQGIDRVRVTWPDRTVQEFTGLEPGFVYRVIESETRSPFSPEQSVPKMWKDAARASGLTFRHQERPFDDYQRENLLPYKLSELGAGIAWGDVNNDQQPDAFCGAAAGQPGQLFVNDQGKFRPAKGPWVEDAECEDMGVLFFDVDGDGDDDLYVVSGSNECSPGDPVLRDRLYLNDGKGEFTKAKDRLPELLDSGSCVSAADFDRDGDLDLFVGGRSVPGKYPLTPKSRLLRNDRGKFTDVTKDVSEGLIDVGLVNAAIWSDYDADGWVDLVIAPEWGPVTFFKNKQGQLTNVTQSLKVDRYLGWWRGIRAVDLDDDGDMDFVVTNQGLNTKYHADPERPHRLYYSDFDNSGTLDLVETEFENGVEYPARGRSCSSNSMPFIKQKFETYHEFATASLLDVYEPTIREKPMREVTFLESAIFWNRSGDEDALPMEVESLPRMAQVSPAFGMVASDFDGDHFVDLFLANNFFAAQPETGFMDGGLSLLLQGNAQHDFEPVWPDRSGITLNVASYGAAAADFDQDGDLDVLVSANNEWASLMQNQSKAEFAKIQVVGPTGNHRGIGSRIILKGDDVRRCVEITAGGGYLSQSFSHEFIMAAKTASKMKELEIIWPDGSKMTKPIEFDDRNRMQLKYASPD